MSIEQNLHQWFHLNNSHLAKTVTFLIPRRTAFVIQLHSLQQPPLFNSQFCGVPQVDCCRDAGLHMFCRNIQMHNSSKKLKMLSTSRKHAYIILTPLKPHFYIVKLGFTGVYIIFLISPQNIDCGYSLEPPRRGGSNEYPQSVFWAEILKVSEIVIWKLSVFWRWNFLYIWIGVFS